MAESLRPRQIAVFAIIVGIAVLAGVIGFGLWTVWYRNTGLREQDQPAPKAQETPYPVAAAGGIPTTGREPDVGSNAKAARLVNPMPPTAQSLAIGKDLFYTYCSPCHGRTGNGRGLMGEVPNLAPAPPGEAEDLSRYLSGYLGYAPDINLNFAPNESDGELYFTITNGGESIMPPFRDALEPEQRWHLINYIKRGLGGPLGIQ